jgi:hypothetical protein
MMGAIVSRDYLQPEYPNRYATPGVYRVDDYPRPERERLPTAVPVFLGVFSLRENYRLEQIQAKQIATRLTRWLQFVDQVQPASYDPYLAHAVRGFFENGGQLCYLLPLNAWTYDDLGVALEELKALDTVDLVCAPGLVSSPDAVVMQTAILNHCELLNDRFAILDALPKQDINGVLAQRMQLTGLNGALYYPWVGIHIAGSSDKIEYVPPCGHVAGVYARSDRRVGVHKAPANEVLMGVLQLEHDLNDADQGGLNPAGVNCLRSFRGRGIRVWGARTLSAEPEWIFVNVRRLFITLGRWIQAEMAELVFEPNNAQLWARIEHHLSVYCLDLLRRGALAGASPDEAFYVHCNAESNFAAESGQVVTLVGLAPTLPGEFIEVRIIHGPAGVTLAGPGRYR